MARQSGPKGSGTARIRLVVLDAEIPDGELGALTQAVQNALRSPVVTVTQRAPAKAIAAQGTEEEATEPEEDAGEEQDAPPTPRQARVKRPMPRAPQVIELDMNSPVSLETFAQGKDAGSQNKKFMIAAAWLKEHRGINAVSADHIYTCFKSMQWSTNIPDFGVPLRDLKNKYKFFGKSDKGYEINHIGLDHVKKLGGGNGAG